MSNTSVSRVDTHRMGAVTAAFFNVALDSRVESSQQRRMRAHYAEIMTAPVQGMLLAGNSSRQLLDPFIHYLTTVS